MMDSLKASRLINCSLACPARLSILDRADLQHGNNLNQRRDWWDEILIIK